MLGAGFRRYFDRQLFSDLIVFWFGMWIAWWFRRWLGHGLGSLPDPTSAGALAFYTLEMRTLVRSILQSFLLACAALAAWRLLRHRPTTDSRRSA